MKPRARTVLVITAVVGLLIGSGYVGRIGVGQAQTARAANPAAGFTPAVIEGHWSGTWRDTSLGTSGAVDGQVRMLANERLYISFSATGPIFGCETQPRIAVSVPKLPVHPSKAPITSARHGGWSPAGFIIEKGSQGFGSLRLVYESQGGVVKVRGSSPPCARGLIYRLRGHLTSKRLRATGTLATGTSEDGVELVASKR